MNRAKVRGKDRGKGLSMRPIFQIQAVKPCLLGLLAVATLALAGCSSSNLSQAYDTTGATAPRTRAATAPAAVHAPRQATARHNDASGRSTDVSATGPAPTDADRRIAGRSDIASDASPAPKPLSDEWLKLEDAKEDKLRRAMNICRGC
jgi:hypothetical protein